MKSKIHSVLLNPLFWFSGILVFFVLQHNTSEKFIKEVVRSDGRGYYAYLPAFFIYNDPHFVKSKDAEERVTGSKDRYYLYKDSEGKVHNKYFPGIAVLQTPFFGMACATSWIMGKEINGYSTIFQLFTLLGSLIYCLLGIWLFYQCLKLLFPEKEKIIQWFIPFFYVSTPLWFYSIQAPTFTHQYSFFLFGLFTLIALKLRKKRTVKKMFLLGIVIGLIALLRPTNVIIVLLLPFLLGSVEKFREVWKDLISSYGLKIWSGILGFLSMAMILLLLWRWQSGEWFVWSYKGEGFNWFHPKIWANLFSFRIGLFVHTPLLLLATIGSFYLYGKNKFQFLFWWLYFIINIWVISAWWCWDYESPFGNRPNTEHLFFLVLPIFYLFEKHRKLTFALTGLFFLIGIYRYQQFTSGAFPNQRFTASSYFKSLQFWNRYPQNRFNFTRSPEAYGNKIEETVLLNFTGEKHVTSKDEFIMGGEADLKLPRTYERYYFRMELDKKIGVDHFEGVHLVVHAYNNDLSSQFYGTSQLFNDRLEGKKEWKHLIFEGTLLDNFQEFEHIKIYIWNQDRQKFSLRNVKITLMKFLSE